MANANETSKPTNKPTETSKPLVDVSAILSAVSEFFAAPVKTATTGNGAPRTEEARLALALEYIPGSIYHGGFSLSQQAKLINGETISTPAGLFDLADNRGTFACIFCGGVHGYSGKANNVRKIRIYSRVKPGSTKGEREYFGTSDTCNRDYIQNQNLHLELANVEFYKKNNKTATLPKFDKPRKA